MLSCTCTYARRIHLFFLCVWLIFVQYFQCLWASHLRYILVLSAIHGFIIVLPCSHIKSSIVKVFGFHNIFIWHDITLTLKFHLCFNPFSANPAKWPNILKQFAGCCRRMVPVCLIVFVGLPLIYHSQYFVCHWHSIAVDNSGC